MVWVKLSICNYKIMNVDNTEHLAYRKASSRTRDKMPQIRDIPYYTGRLVTQDLDNQNSAVTLSDMKLGLHCRW